MKIIRFFLIIASLSSIHIFITYINFFSNDLFFVQNEITVFFSDRLQKFIFEVKESSKNYHLIESYDVRKIDLSLKIDFENEIVYGSERILISKKNNVNKIAFNCGKNIKINKILINNKPYSKYFHKNKFLIFYFDYWLTSQDVLEFQIDYSFKYRFTFYKGFILDKETKHFYTLSEPNFASFWYICKEDPADKFLAQVDLIIPSFLFGVSNGKLIESTYVNENEIKYRYKSKYPISYYLLFVAGGDYKIYEKEIVTELGSRIYSQNLFFPEHFENGKESLVINDRIFNLFEKIVAKYPFQDELYGVVEVLWPYGGMEHQTRSAISYLAFESIYPKFDLLAHELAHQWFGNSVTLKNWEDIWLNEGFASFFEEFLLSGAKFPEEIILNDSYYFYGKVIDSERFLFSRTSYDKGAWILKMLWNYLEDDKFWKIIKTYYENYKYSNASTEDFIKVCNEISGQNLDWFFDQWVFNEIERPVYEVSFSSDNKGKNYICKVKIKQIQPRYVFKNELDILLYFGNKNKKMKLLNNSREQILFFESSVPLTKVVIDLQSKILKKVIYKNTE